METRKLTCIGCPRGCQLEVVLNDVGEVESLTGNTCKIGDTYGRKEVTNPTRIVTSVVKVQGGELGVVSCKTAADIPKGKIFDITDALKDAVVKAPVKIGDVLVSNVCETGVDIVATKNIKAI